jgi:uncharacterized protein with gpF-like domain
VKIRDLNRSTEAARQAALLAKLEVPFRKAVEAEVAKAMREMVAGWKASGKVPTAAEHRKRIAELFEPMAEKLVKEFADRIVTQAKASGYVLETKDFAATMAAAALRYIASEAIRKRIVAIAETTRDQIIRGVTAGFDAGLGQDGIAARILDRVPLLSKSRAAVIARTETHGAANFGANEAAQETGVAYRREWLAGSDARTRKSHQRADGQRVAKDKPFTVGGARLMYPGDPSGPADETINCRCAIGFIVD